MNFNVKFAILIISLMLISCKHKEKFEFIQKFLDNPDNLEEILLISEFDTEYFRKFFLTEKMRKIFVQCAERFKIKDAYGNTKIYFDVKGYNEGEIRNSEKGNRLGYFIFIDNKNKDFRLVFKWYKNDNDKWYLVDIQSIEELPDDVYD